MSLTLTGLESIINECIENELKIAIICDREVASIVEEYCNEYDLSELHNVIQENIPYAHKDSGYVITIICQDGEYEYYIDFYKYGEKLSGEFDQLHVIGKEFYTLGWDIASYEECTMYSDMSFDEDELPEAKSEHDCPECCFTCDDTECEYQGNADDCECNDCYEAKEEVKKDSRTLHRNEFEKHIRKTLPADMSKEAQDLFVQLNYYADAVNNSCCQECLLKILCDFHEEVNNKSWDNGYNDHKDYMLDCLAKDNCNCK